MKALVSLVGEQAAPNLFLAAHYKPDILVWLHSSKTQGVAENLKKALEKLAAEEGRAAPESRLVLLKPENEPSVVRSRLLEALDDFPEGAEIFLNITSGTKLMAIGVLEAKEDLTKRGFRVSTLYFDIDSKRVRRIEKREWTPINASVSLEVFLRAYGNEVISKPKLDEEQWNALLETAMLLSQRPDLAVRITEELHKEKKEGPPNPPKVPGLTPRTEKVLENMGLLKGGKPIQEKRGKAKFQFWTGDWLSVLVVEALRELGFNPLALAQLGNPLIGNENEIDAVLVHRMRLWVFECKFLHAKKPSNKKKKKPSIKSDVIYRTITVARNLGGIDAVAVIVSNKPPGRTERGLKVIKFSGYEALKEELSKLLG